MPVDRGKPAEVPLEMGVITGPYGVRGWVRITTFTEAPENLLQYTPWYLHTRGQWQAVQRLEGRVQAKGLVAHLQDC